VTAPDWIDVIDFFESLESESDRAVPILAFGFIDSEIERLLREAVNQDVHGGVKQLFGALGPLGSASARINMAHALHWLTTEVVEDLHLLRRIRNRYAHGRIDGLDEAAVAMIRNHRQLPRMLEAMLETADTPGVDYKKAAVNEYLFTPRERLVAASAFTAWTALAQLYIAPTALRLGVSPANMLDPGSGVHQTRSWCREASWVGC
jgi:DNA-binding MltR family transcriptional regulator